MEVQFSSLITCPVVFGRNQELKALRSLVEQVRSGEMQIILVSGEAGIGKSRLVAEVKAAATAHGFLLLEGQCFQTDRESPYAPLLDLFRAYFARWTSTVHTDPTHAFASTLSHLLPELALLFPDLAALPMSPAGDPEEEKRYLFAAMVHFIAEQAIQHPVFLMIEDIHWCDDLTLELLLHLVRRCRRVPLLLLVTYRHEEQHPRLRQWITQLDRERVVQECSLKCLSRDNVAGMIRVMLNLQQEVNTDLLDTIYTRSEGNPFFVEELLKSLMTSGELASVDGTWKLTTHRTLIPRSVEEAVQQRIAYLSTDARRLVTLAAVAGYRFNVTLLREILQCEEGQLLALLKEVMIAQLVVEEATDQFAFLHALTQEAIMASLLLRERQGMHRRIVETLERLCNSSPTYRERYLEELASHSNAAGLWEQALAYAQEAGKKALRLYAQQTAIDHFTHAIEAAHHLSQTPPAFLYLARGQAYETLGDFERARHDYERSLAAARTMQDSPMEWQSMMAIGFLWTGRNYERAEVWFRQALALAEQLADPALRARSLNRLSNWRLNTGRIQEAQETLQEALHLLETQQNNQVMAETLEMLGMATFFMGDPATAVKVYFERAIELFRVLGDQQGLLSNLAAQALDSAPETIETTSSSLRTREVCVHDAEEALRLARQTNSQAGQAFVEIATTGVLFSFGEFGSALAHAQEALRIATAIGHQEWIAATYGMLGQLYLLLLEADKAASYLEAALADSQALGSAIWTKQLTPYLALTYILRREFPRAEAVLKTIMPREQQPRNFFERQAARAWGELALAQGETQYALHIAKQLIVSTPGVEQQPIPHLLALKGEALLALKHLEEAAETLEEAKNSAELRQAPSILWRIQRSLGRVHHLLKREEQAQHEWHEARTIIARLAATIDETPLREHFLHTALATLPPEKSLSQKAYTSRKYGGLSAREREVAALVAQGKNNREIAASLVVSERTAEAHISNILSKLGFTTRTQIATWAIEKGLLPTH
jgi:DNA-binding CsgD family transcriptional regulator